MSAGYRRQEEIGSSARRLTGQSMARAATGAISVSVLLIVLAGILGPSAVVPAFPSASPWPPWFINARPSPSVVAALTWLALLVGAVGLVAGLVATRRGWRPRPARVISWSIVAVTALMLISPIASKDMLSYAAFGRILTLGHSPYTMMPAALKSSGDPVGAVVSAYLHQPSRFGPIATILEAAASKRWGISRANYLLAKSMERARISRDRTHARPIDAFRLSSKSTRASAMVGQSPDAVGGDGWWS